MSTSMRCTNGHTWRATDAPPQHCPVCGLTVAEPAAPACEEAATMPPAVVASATVTVPPCAAAGEPATALAARVPGYVIERELGRGGMGVVYQARTGLELRTLRGAFMSVAFAADGQVLASASVDNTVKLWDARTGRELRTLRGHTDPVTSVAFAADGQVLASGSGDDLFGRGDNAVTLWNVRTGQELRTLRGRTYEVTSVAFAADGQVLAAASNDKTVKLWDIRTGQELRTLRGHTRAVTSVAFAADGQVVASASHDNTIKLWDARTGHELSTLRGHTTGVLSVAFAADSQVLASASVDKTVKLWDVRSGEEPDKKRRFRLWVTAPDLHLHRELAEQADKDKQPFALAFRLGRYLAAKTYYAANPKDEVKPPFSDRTFPDGIACTGVLYKDSGIAPARLLIGTARALQGDASNWLNHAFHGGALYRSGERAKALAALNEAVKLHGKPSPLTHNLLGLTHLAMGQKDEASDARAQRRLATMRHGRISSCTGSSCPRSMRRSQRLNELR